MKKTLTLAILLLLNSSLLGQSWEENDTLYFCDVKSYVYGPPYCGRIQVEVCAAVDNYITGLVAPLLWTGPVNFDTVVFPFPVHSSFSEISEPDSIAFFGIGNPYFAGQWNVANLVGTVQDTGIMTLDSCQYNSLELFFNFNAAFYTPSFRKLEHRVEPDSIIPGDISRDETLNIADVLKLLNYLFRQQTIEFKPAADVNSDCRITLADVIYLANHVLKSGPKPIPGCVWD